MALDQATIDKMRSIERSVSRDITSFSTNRKPIEERLAELQAEQPRDIQRGALGTRLAEAAPRDRQIEPERDPSPHRS